MPKVFIGIGHGGKDPGAIGKNGFMEKDLNLSIATACKDVLTRHGIEVLMSRYTDENDSLNEEIRECNTFSPDLAVDIHINAGAGDGAEVYYHYGGGISKTLAENVLKEIVAIGQNSRGAKTKTGAGGTDYFGFIRETVCPACIVECAFIDNQKDIAIIDTAEEQIKMGKAIAKGILITLNIEFKEENEMERFKDVTENHWAYEAIVQLAEKNIVNGYEDGTFKPDEPITRAEAAVIISRIMEVK